MNLILWGLLLVILGLVLGLTGFFGIGGLLTVGWLLLIVGIVLAIMYALGRASRRPA